MKTDHTCMRLGALLSAPALGYHPAAWRHLDVRPEHSLSFDHYRDLAHAAERGRFDMVLLTEAVGEPAHDGKTDELRRQSHMAYLEPLTLLSALAVHTRHIGLAATVTTTCHEPFPVARTLASLDFISGGRCGWHITVPVTDAEARNFGMEQRPGEAMGYHRAHEFLAVTTRLWDGWEDDAFVYDQAAGRYFDPDKLHVPDHRGEHFQVRGPLNIARPPQGRPVLVHSAGTSSDGDDLAAGWADVVLTGRRTLKQAQGAYRALRELITGCGRNPDEVRIMSTVSLVTGRTQSEAEDAYGALENLLDPDIRRETPAGGRGPLFLIGTPRSIADELEEWFTQGAADGFMFMPSHLPHGLTDIVDLVVPELQRRGLVRTRYEGPTLRDHLGLPRPEPARPSGPRSALERISKGS